MSIQILNHYKSQITEAIRQTLYPPKDFPRSQYPNLEQVVYSSFRNQASRNPSILKAVCSGKQINVEKLDHYIGWRNLIFTEPYSVILLFMHRLNQFVQSCESEFYWQKELSQQVLLNLLTKKIFHIQQNFCFTDANPGKFNKYLMVSIQRTYHEVARLYPFTSFQSADEIRESSETESHYMNKFRIQEEIRILKSVIEKSFKDFKPLELLIRVKYRLTISPEFVRAVIPRCPKKCVAILSGDLTCVQDRDICCHLSRHPMIYRKQVLKPDSIRRAIHRHIADFIVEINRARGGAVYTTTNFRFLAEVYFDGGIS